MKRPAYMSGWMIRLLIAMTIVYLAVVKTDTALPIDAQWTGFVLAAVTVVAVVLFPLGVWIYRRRHSFTIRFTWHPFPLANQKKRVTVPVGDSDIFVRILVRSAPIEFDEVMVRAKSTKRRWRVFGWLPHREYIGLDNGEASILEVADAEQENNPQGPRKFHTRDRPDGGGMIGEFMPPWQRNKGRSVLLRVRIRASDAWSGMLGVMAPNANGSTDWKHLRIQTADVERHKFRLRR